MIRVYIAGPMRGIAEFNFPAFLEAQDWFDNGPFLAHYETFNPAVHDIDNGFEHGGLTGNEDLTALGFDLRAALAADLEYITKYADAILLLPGWEKSKGARAELATAQALGLQAAVYDDMTPWNENIPWRLATDFHPSTLAPAITHPQHDSVDDAFGCQNCQGGLSVKNSVFVGSSGEDVTTAINAALGSGEVRVVDPITGGEKGTKPERFDLIPVGALREVARVYGFGAQKYADNNWRKGYAWHLSYAANQRHLTAFWDGEDLDPESQLPHLAHAAWQSLTLLQFYLDGLGTDDRFKR